MVFAEFFDYDSEFISESEIKNYIKNSINFKADLENPDDSEALSIFQTVKQKTWLVSTNRRLYCILDDIRKEKPHINWSIQKSDLVDGSKIIIDLITHETRKKYKTIGCVDIGQNHKNWLYSKPMFKDQDIVESIKMLIYRNMVDK